MPDPKQVPTGSLRLSGLIRSARVTNLYKEDCKTLQLELSTATDDSLGKFDRNFSLHLPVSFATPLHDEMFEDGHFELQVVLHSRHVKILKESEMIKGEPPPEQQAAFEKLKEGE